MRNVKWIRFVAVLAAGWMTLTVAARKAHADRRSSLAGNLLITDQDDIYIYPQLTLEHRNLVSFDFFPGNSLTNVLGAGAQNNNTQQPNNNGTLPGNGTTRNGTAGTTDTGGNTTTGALGSYDEASGGLPGGPNAMGGGGLLLFGQDNFAFGVASHRQDLYGATPAQFLGIGDLQMYGAGGLNAWGYLGHNSPAPGSVFLPTAPGGQAVAGGGGGMFLQPMQLADLLVGFAERAAAAAIAGGIGS